MANRQRRAWGLVAEAPVIGFVGRIVDDKGIKELIEAFRVVRAARPDAQLLVVGSIEPGLSATTQATLESPGIVVTNRLEDTSIAHLVIDVLVLPTYREGFPNVPLEAAAAESPVVTTTATGALDSVIDGKTGFLVPPADRDALAEAILKLVENPDRARPMGVAGRQWVEVRLLTDRGRTVEKAEKHRQAARRSVSLGLG
jgi:glycosyltransferase involved in cell wall biosynthesis